MAVTLERAKDWRRQRSLASDARAGSWSAGEARRLQWKFVRTHWRRLCLGVAIGVTPSVSVVFLPGWARGVFLGAIWASVAWVMTLGVTLLSGSASRVMGQTGEQWTAQELRSHLTREWRILNHLLVGRADVDHVAVGPGGLVVIETKWTSWPFDPEYHATAARRLAEQADRVRRMLKPHLGDVRVSRAVVVWGPDIAGSDETQVINGIEVVPGPSLADWLDRVPTSGTLPPQIEAAWRRLDADSRVTDAREARVNRHPRPFDAIVREVLLGGAGAVTGVVVLAKLWVLVGDLTWAVVCPIVLLVAAAWIRRRWSSARSFTTGWLLAIGASGVIVLGYALIRSV